MTEPLTKGVVDLKHELVRLINKLNGLPGGAPAFLVTTLNHAYSKFTELEKVEKDIPHLESKLHTAVNRRDTLRMEVARYEGAFRSHVRHLLEEIAKETDGTEQSDED